jgi:hypothetical protein
LGSANVRSDGGAIEFERTTQQVRVTGALLRPSATYGWRRKAEFPVYLAILTAASRRPCPRQADQGVQDSPNARWHALRQFGVVDDVADAEHRMLCAVKERGSGRQQQTMKWEGLNVRLLSGRLWPHIVKPTVLAHACPRWAASRIFGNRNCRMTSTRSTSALRLRTAPSLRRF